MDRCRRDGPGRSSIRQSSSTCSISMDMVGTLTQSRLMVFKGSRASQIL